MATYAEQSKAREDRLKRRKRKPGESQSAADTRGARAKTQTSQNVPLDIRTIDAQGGPESKADAKRLAQFKNSTKGREMFAAQQEAGQAPRRNTGADPIPSPSSSAPTAPTQPGAPTQPARSGVGKAIDAANALPGAIAKGADLLSGGAAKPQLPSNVQPGSPQANFLANRGSMTPEKEAEAHAYAKSIGTTFDPKTGYDRSPFEKAKGANGQGANGQPKEGSMQYSRADGTFSAERNGGRSLHGMTADKKLRTKEDFDQMSDEYFGTPMTGERAIDPQTGEPMGEKAIAVAKKLGIPLSYASVPMTPRAAAVAAGEKRLQAKRDELAKKATNKPTTYTDPKAKSQDLPKKESTASSGAKMLGENSSPDNKPEPLPKPKESDIPLYTGGDVAEKEMAKTQKEREERRAQPKPKDEVKINEFGQKVIDTLVESATPQDPKLINAISGNVDDVKKNLSEMPDQVSSNWDDVKESMGEGVEKLKNIPGIKQFLEAGTRQKLTNLNRRLKHKGDEYSKSDEKRYQKLAKENGVKFSKSKGFYL